MSSFSPQEYWEDRLRRDWTLQGVGLQALGRRFNDWAYRLRRERFEAVVTSYVKDLASARVLDIGSGTGFYIQAWRGLGVHDLVALDVTTTAVTNLRSTFPDVSVVLGDISEGVPGQERETFDVASAMDVMFHIVDRQRFVASLDNISRLLVPGGLLIWTDFFTHRREVLAGHIALRSLYRVEELLDRAGFDVITRQPFFFVMNEPRDAWRGALLLWRGVMWAATRTEVGSKIGGWALYHLDRQLCSRRNESPSTEIMVCRKRTSCSPD